MQRLTNFVQVRPGEARMVALVAAFFALVELGRGIGGSAADALFFLRFGVDNLPYMYLALGVANFIRALLYAALLNHFSKGRFFAALLLVFALVLLAERAAIALELRALYPVLWLTVNAVSLLLGTMVWNTAGEVCDTRQAKRLFPLFVSAAILGGLLGSLITGPAARLLGTENLIVLFALLLLCALLLVGVIARGLFRPALYSSETTSFLLDIRAGFDIVRRTPMLQLLAVSAVLFSILYFSVSFPFGKAVSAAFTSEADVAGFLGLFSGVASAVTFVAALLIANRLYARIGVVNSLLLLPLTYFLGFVLFAASFSLTSAVVVRLVQLVVLSGIGDGAYSTFFNIVPSEKRAQVRAFDAGVPAQIGIILSGLLLIFGVRVLDTTQIFVMGMLCALACAYVIWRMRRGYAEALVAALRAGRFEVFTAGGTAFAWFRGDANAIQVAVNALSDTRPSTRRLGAEMLMKMGANSAVPALLTGLQDSDAEVRGMAVCALGELEAFQAADAVVNLLNDPDASVRASALMTLPRLLQNSPLANADVALQRKIESLLKDSDVRVQIEAAVTLAQLGSADEVSVFLDRLLHDPGPDTRALALSALGKIASMPASVTIGGTSGVQAIIQAVGDEATLVRRTACGHLAKFDDPDAFAALVGCLNDPDETVRLEAARGLRRHDAQTSDAVLRVLLTGPVSSREASLAALAPGKAEQFNALHDFIAQEVTRLRNWRELAAAVPKTTATTAFAGRVLDSHIEHSKRCLVKAIGLLGQSDAMDLVADSLKASDSQMQATAIEVLDQLSDRALAKEIIPLLEEQPTRVGEASAPSLSHVTVITRLLAEDDRWLRAPAARAIGALKLRDLLPELRKLATDSDMVVSEAAHDSLRELDEEPGEPMETLQTVSLMERIMLLREVPLFAGLSPDDLKQVADIARERWYPDGAVVFHEGDNGSELHVIAAGQVRVTKHVNGEDKLLATRGVGEFIGEMAIIDSVPRFATLHAQGEVRTLSIDGNMFKTILRDRPDVSLAVLRGLSRRLRERD